MDAYDDEYRDGLAVALYKTIAEYSRSDGAVAVVKTGAAFDALMMVGAMIMSGSPQVDTTQKVRFFSENVAKKLRHELRQAQEDPTIRQLISSTYDPSKTN